MEFLTEYNLTGLVIGIATFLITVVPPARGQGRILLGVRCWWVFLVMGIVAIAASVAVRHILWSTLLAVWGRLVALVDRRTVRAAPARGERLFPANPKRQGK